MLPGKGKPGFPLNILADFAGGGMTCANGILLALLDRARTGKGQVVSADMVSGARYISSFPLIHKSYPTSPVFSHPTGENLLDGGAPFYDVYACSPEDYKDEFMSLGCLEPQFFAAFITKFNDALPISLKVDYIASPEDQFDRENWPRLREYITKGFLTQTREFWSDLFHNTDACCVPVLNAEEAAQFDSDKSYIPSPQPSLSRFESRPKHTSAHPIILNTGEHTHEVLTELGYDDFQISKLVLERVIDPNLIYERSKL
jgi:alpha-methylacyl-CoA racemase